MNHLHKHALQPAFSFYILGTFKRYGQRFSDIVRVFLPPFIVAAIGQIINTPLLAVFNFPTVIVSLIVSIIAAVFAVIASVGFVSYHANPEGVPLSEIYSRGIRLFFPKIWTSYLSLGTLFAVPMVLIAIINFYDQKNPLMALISISISAVAVLFLGPKLICVSQAFAIEGERGSGAISRSLDITAGRQLGILGRLALGSIFMIAGYFVVFYILGLSFGDINPDPGTYDLPISGQLINDLLGALFFAPLALIFGVSLYENLVVGVTKKENNKAPVWVWVSVGVFTISVALLVWLVLSGLALF